MAKAKAKTVNTAAKATKDNGPWVVGRKYFIRTVTYFQVGELVAVYPGELVLKDVAWVADTERFYNTLRDGTVREAEPFPDGEVIVNRSAIVDAAEWCHPLIRTQI